MNGIPQNRDDDPGVRGLHTQVVEFICESVAIPPGTKVQANQGRRPASAPQAGWWVLGAGVTAIAFLIGWLVGRG